MRELKFRRAFAKNLLCFGEQGIEIFFDDFGSVVRIGGINHDNISGNGQACDNGVGKSTVPEILSVGLFGRTIKNPTKLKGGNVIHDKATSDCVIEVEWDEYKVVRTIKRNGTTKLELWKSADHIWDKDSCISKGKTDTEAEIIKALGLTHRAFCNIVIVDDADTYAFLEADTPTKRELIENVLDLDRYRAFTDAAKALLKAVNERVAELSKDYERLKIELDACVARIKRAKDQEAAWVVGKKTEMTNIERKIQEKMTALENTGNGEELAKYQQAQAQIVKLTEDSAPLKAEREKLVQAIATARERLAAARQTRDEINTKIQARIRKSQAAQEEQERAQKLIDKLGGLKEGAKCPVCYGTVDPANYAALMEHTNSLIEKCMSACAESNAAVVQDRAEFGKQGAVVSKLEEMIAQAEKRVATIDSKVTNNTSTVMSLSRIPKPEGNTVQQVLEAEIVQLQQQLQQKKAEAEGVSPFIAILNDAETEKAGKETAIAAKEKELKEVEAEIPYYEFWVKSFGDKGIRKYIIDGIIPALNSKIAYWLHYLIDGKIELTFDNQLEESVKRNGVPTAYCGLSKSEKRRVNLAVSQAFAHVMMINSGCCPNLIYLDEITGGGIDQTGIDGVCNMVFELAKERRVFITTHDDKLLDMLQGCETLQLQKRDDVTVLLS
jgi:DNA repair exonuclease SbcCD ATPase subunit